jgi:pimeloyl-ACP methyl ester carboxylesterase
LINFIYDDVTMAPVVNTYTFRNATLVYSCSGKGDHVWFAFHGFGQDHRVFEPLSQTYFNSVTLYSFDLFFHGSDIGLINHPIEKEFWKSCIEQFMLEHGISQISLLGFSLGARMALSLLESMPHKIDQVHVLAPDGIHTDFWYSLATSSLPGRIVFKTLIQNPLAIFTLLDVIRKLGLIDDSIRYFAESQLATQDKRDQVYRSWTAFRHLKISKSFFRHTPERQRSKLTIILARNDQVINNRQIERSIQKASNTTLVWLNCSHNRLIAEYISGGLLKYNQSQHIP